MCDLKSISNPSKNMENIKIDNCLFKTIGFMDCASGFQEALSSNSFHKKSFDDSTQYFLKNSYHAEFLNIMFCSDDSGVEIFSKKVNYQIKINKRENDVTLSNIDVYIFNNTHQNTKTSIFALTYKPSVNNLGEVSDISNDLKNHNCEIHFDTKTQLLKDFISEHVFFGNKLINIEAIYKIENIFLYYYMQSTNFKNDFYSRRVGLISGVSQDDLLNIKIPVMEKNIQVKLTKELDNFLTNYKKKTTLLNEYYEKIIEYYWQLIFEKVTLGK